ncbi:MAG: glycosyltransferase family 9 protein [Rhodocyclales bacterium]|nr:glycosyltransferase family 9 protein [Rhodocyclales bacterium]
MTARAVLVIRRDNIGDLVCTTPLLAALRRQLPQARIAALVTRYNAAVLAGNPDVDAVYSYTKGKHRAPGESVFALYTDRLRTILALRRQRFDWVLLPGGAQPSALRFASWIGGRRLLVRGGEDDGAGPHEVEQTCHLLVRMGLRYETPAVRVMPNAAELAAIDALLAGALPQRPRRLVGLHISARKPSQRWPVERFTTTMRRLRQSEDVAFMLLWAPGSADNPQHPGDDDKAAAILAAAAGIPVVPVVTARLEQLVAAVARCDAFICGDGGAMHLAAGLGKPTVALFGQSGPERWRPWGVPQVVLQEPSRDVGDIDADEAVAAFLRLPVAAAPNR